MDHRQFDYYVFIDDDLQFFKPKVSFAPVVTYLLYKFNRGLLGNAYEPATPEYFFSRLERHLTKYRPEVLSAVNYSLSASRLDVATMKKNSFVRRMGWFDAQFTVLSNYAASKLLPYDTKISGWWSAQIPIYLYAYHVFGLKSLGVCDIAVINGFNNTGYVLNYNGFQDCKNMLAAISEATGKDFTQTFRQETTVDVFYGEQEIQAQTPSSGDAECYAANFADSLKGIETMYPNMAFSGQDGRAGG